MAPTINRKSSVYACLLSLSTTDDDELSLSEPHRPPGITLINLQFQVNSHHSLGLFRSSKNLV